MKIKKYLFLLLLFFIPLQGCTVLNMLPNAERDAYYMDHGPTFHDHFYKVHYGMTKTEVLEILGPADGFKGEDVWVYVFPDDWVREFYVKFKDGKVIKVWG